MTKADIVAEITEKTGLERSETLKVVEAFMVSIKSSLAKGEMAKKKIPKGSMSI